MRVIDPNLFNVIVRRKFADDRPEKKIMTAGNIDILNQNRICIDVFIKK